MKDLLKDMFESLVDSLSDPKTVKGLATAATFIGFGLTLVTNFTDDAKLKNMVKEEVALQLTDGTEK